MDSPSRSPVGLDVARALAVVGAHERGARLGIIALTLTFGVIGTLSVFMPQGAYGSPVRMTLLAVISATTVPAAFLVTRMQLSAHWFARPGSLLGLNNLFVIYADVGVTAALVTLRDPHLAMFGTALFAVVGGYVAHFVKLRIVLLHVGFTTLAIAVLALWSGCRGAPPITVVYLALIAWVAANGIVLLLRTYSTAFQRALKVQLDWANTDSLTGVFNRRGFTDVTTEAIRVGGRLTVVMIDVDHFKHINDTHGHVVGDAILMRLATQIGAAAGRDAVVGRLGGDEFAVASNLDLPDIRAVMEDLVAHPVDTVGAAPVTVSVGAATACSIPRSLPLDRRLSVLADAIARADDALLAAKSAGRNTYVIATEESGAADDSE